MKWMLILNLFAYYVSLCLIQNKILLVKLKKHIVLIGTCLFLLLYAIFSIQQIPVEALAAFAVAPVIIPLFVKLSLHKSKLRSILSSYLFLISVYVIFSSILAYFAKIEAMEVDAIMSWVLVAATALCCFTKISQKISLALQWIPLYMKRLIIFLSLSSGVAVTLMAQIQENANNADWLNVTYIIFSVVIVLVCSMLPILVATTISNKMLNHQALHYKTQIEEQAKHYEAVAKSNWEIRRFQHDTKNLTVGLTNLLETGQQKEAMEMLNSYYNASLGLKDEVLLFDTGNGIVDALLADKQQTACAINTQIQFEGMVPAKGVSPSDLCVLFGNTLDNALDACGKFSAEEEKTIRIVSKSVGGYLWLTVQNPVVENMKIKNNTIATTKEDKHHHGFGLYSLQKLAKEHQGELKLSCENNLFTIAVELNIGI